MISAELRQDEVPAIFSRFCNAIGGRIWIEHAAKVAAECQQYFQRNAQAAAALIQGFDATLLAARLEREVIGIAYD